jgi:hypothetical protein
VARVTKLLLHLRNNNGTWYREEKRIAAILLQGEKIKIKKGYLIFEDGRVAKFQVRLLGLSLFSFCLQSQSHLVVFYHLGFLVSISESKRKCSTEIMR